MDMNKATGKYYKRVVSEFLKDKNYNKEQYKNIRKIYKDITEYYDNRIKEDKDFDVKIEKLRLERNFGKQVGIATNYNIAFYIAILCPLVVLILQESLDNFKSSYKFIGIIGIVIMIFVLVFMFMRESDKVNPRELMILISLKVLEDMEKQNQSKNNLPIDEVAATIDDNIEKDIVSKRNNRGMGWILNIIPIINIVRKR
ncbi:hypothetical protein [Clostridium sp. DJ247]|uniref:hypothetical protein n=1 Tax=Clostridium sp. DJ247 TaxID=2726188 RepID=UPI0016289EC1|nr:hypothetical protein [Clostridium sp. DJ247]MBC2579978.1 hypothetical protein [Clostridium sp. DJ247]